MDSLQQIYRVCLSGLYSTFPEQALVFVADTSQIYRR